MKQRIVVDLDTLTGEFGVTPTNIHRPTDAFGLLGLALADFIARVAADMVRAQMQGTAWRNTTAKPDEQAPAPDWERAPPGVRRM